MFNKFGAKLGLLIILVLLNGCDKFGGGADPKQNFRMPEIERPSEKYSYPYDAFEAGLQGSWRSEPSNVFPEFIFNKGAITSISKQQLTDTGELRLEVHVGHYSFMNVPNVLYIKWEKSSCAQLTNLPHTLPFQFNSGSAGSVENGIPEKYRNLWDFSRVITIRDHLHFGARFPDESIVRTKKFGYFSKDQFIEDKTFVSDL